jgi:F0F1-type ATP synthase alpha subunit
MTFENITSQVANIQVGESFRGRIVNALGGSALNNEKVSVLWGYSEESWTGITALTKGVLRTHGTRSVSMATGITAVIP